MAGNAQSTIYMIYPWITLGEEMVTYFEKALEKHDINLFLVTKLVKEDIFYRRQQLEDIEQWREIFGDKIHIKYNNSIHAKMIIVDDDEVLLGSSNLTGSGMGSTRELEGYPQIEANIYTDDHDTVQKCSEFFSKVWYHEDSIDYLDSEYVLSCKSHSLSCFYKNYSKIFKIIARDNGIKRNGNSVQFKGKLCYLDNEKAYVSLENRNDLAVRINDIKNLNKYRLGQNISVSGKIIKNSFGDFEVNPANEKICHESSKIKYLKENDREINIKAKIHQIKEPIKLDTKYGIRYLTLIEIGDDTGTILLEIWRNDPLRLKANIGDKIKTENCYVKKFKGELRLTPIKNDGKVYIIE